jgi:hypothetical protein
MAGTSLPNNGKFTDLTFVCDSDLSAKQYFGVIFKAGEPKTVTIATVAGAEIVGILQNAPNGSSADTVAVVRVDGPSFAIAGGTATLNTLGTCDSNGRFVDATGTDKSAPVLFHETVTTSGDKVVVTIVQRHKA